MSPKMYTLNVAAQLGYSCWDTTKYGRYGQRIFYRFLKEERHRDDPWRGVWIADDNGEMVYCGEEIPRAHLEIVAIK